MLAARLGNPKSITTADISHEGENWTHGEVGECVQQLISQATKPTIFENAQKRLAARM